MAWVTGSNNSKPQFQALRWRLLLSYLTVMVAILGTSAVATYQLFNYSLYQQLDRGLDILAQAAAHSLVAIKQQYPEILENHIEHKNLEAQADAQGDLRRLDGDEDLDIPWQYLREPDQGVEWFNAKGQLIGNAGTIVLETRQPPRLPLQSGVQTLNHGQIRTITIAAYSNDKGRQILEGYVRTSESTQEVEEDLRRLRWVLGLGSIVALSLTGVGGLWLTKQSLKPIERSFQQLKQFTADASHELRSPLTAIKTSIQVIQNHPERIHPADAKKLAAIASATSQMTRLVEDLLLLERIVAPTTARVRARSLPLDEVLEDLLELAELQVQEKAIVLKSNLLVNVWVNGDADQLRRLFTNLLENALQYTSTGEITVSMTCSDRVVVVSVEDTGIGIAPENLPFVFDRLWRADKARSVRESGLGMGLAIAQTIARRHRGEISVSSQLGVGSCFRVRLPVV